jgi:hypothetical protein
VKRVAYALVFVLGGGMCVAACSSKSSDLGPADAASQPADAGNCGHACCVLPQPRTACNVDAGTECDYEVACSEGLVVSRSVVCRDGTWTSLSDCPPTGGVDARGCPSAQPTNGTPCALDGGSRGPCGYTRSCGAQLCDGGVCVPVIQSAQAQCINGLWQTTALGPC